jgi:hypothetical protein
MQAIENGTLIPGIISRFDQSLAAYCACKMGILTKHSKEGGTAQLSRITQAFLIARSYPSLPISYYATKNITGAN